MCLYCEYYKKHMLYDNYLQNITCYSPDDRDGVGAIDNRSYGQSCRFLHQGRQRAFAA